MDKKNRPVQETKNSSGNKYLFETATPEEKQALIQVRLRLQTLESGWYPEQRNSDDIEARVTANLALVESLESQDNSEAMLATQMVAAHNAAMECARRAMIADQTLEGRDHELKHMAKLMSLYTQQLDALNKHRGKGQQKVTVEHVYVQAGGQAVIGHVDTSAPLPKPTDHASTVKDVAPWPGKVLEAPSQVLSKRRKKGAAARDKA